MLLALTYTAATNQHQNIHLIHFLIYIFCLKNFFTILFNHLFLADWVFIALRRFSLVAVSRGSSLWCCAVLLSVVASLAVEHGLQACEHQSCSAQAQQLQPAGPRAHRLSSCSQQAREHTDSAAQHVSSVVATHRLSTVAHGLSRGIFLDQGSNLCPWHWQVDSYPLCHLGSPAFRIW